MQKPDFTRQPPQNEEAEKAVLGSVFIRPSVLDLIADLDEDDFLQPMHREIFGAMRTVAKRGRAIDPVTVADEMVARDYPPSRLPGGQMYLNDLANGTPTAENAGHYAAIVGAAALARRVIAVCADVSSSAYGVWNDPGELLAEFRAKVSRLELRGRTASRRISDDIDEVLKQIELRGQNPDQYGVTMGINSLDEMLGPLRPDNLVAIAANPSRGKTALAWNTALRAAARGIPVLYFSLEQSREQMIERGLSGNSRIDGRQVALGRMDLPQWRRLSKSSTRLHELPVWINDDRLTAKRLISELRVWRSLRRRELLQEGKDPATAELALAVVDYVQLVEHEESSENRAVEMGKISALLKLATKKNDCNMPIIECLQLNRENTKGDRGGSGKMREPILSDIRDSGNFEQDADAILFPWWTGTPTERGVIEHGGQLGPLRHAARILVKKNRITGVTGSAKVIWEPEFTTFSDRTPDDITTEEDA